MKQTDLEAGFGNITLSSGDGTDTITFDQVFDKAPTVLITLAEDPGSGKRGLIWVHTITVTGFIAEIDSDGAGSDIDYGWIAMERRASEKASQ